MDQDELGESIPSEDADDAISDSSDRAEPCDQDSLGGVEEWRFSFAVVLQMVGHGVGLLLLFVASLCVAAILPSWVGPCYEEFADSGIFFVLCLDMLLDLSDTACLCIPIFVGIHSPQILGDSFLMAFSWTAAAACLWAVRGRNPYLLHSVLSWLRFVLFCSVIKLIVEPVLTHQVATSAMSDNVLSQMVPFNQRKAAKHQFTTYFNDMDSWMFHLSYMGSNGFYSYLLWQNLCTLEGHACKVLPIRRRDACCRCYVTLGCGRCSCSCCGALILLTLACSIVLSFLGVSSEISSLLDLENSPHGRNSISLSPRVTGIVALCSGEIFSTFDSMGKRDNLITLSDMDSMLANFEDDAAPWAHFVYDIQLGDYQRYALPTVIGEKVRYNNVLLRDLIMQADIDEDDVVNGTEINETMWRASFVSDVADAVLYAQNDLQNHIVASLTSLGVSDTTLFEMLAKRNASASHALRDISFEDNKGAVFDAYEFMRDSNSPLHTSWASAVDDALDMFDTLILLKGESAEDFRIRFQNGNMFDSSVSYLRRILTNDLAGRMRDKPYEQIQTSSFTSHEQVTFDTRDWMADTGL